MILPISLYPAHFLVVISVPLVLGIRSNLCGSPTRLTLFMNTSTSFYVEALETVPSLPCKIRNEITFFYGCATAFHQVHSEQKFTLVNLECEQPYSFGKRVQKRILR
jgi:hypothetical protein